MKKFPNLMFIQYCSEFYYYYMYEDGGTVIDMTARD